MLNPRESLHAIAESPNGALPPLPLARMRHGAEPGGASLVGVCIDVYNFRLARGHEHITGVQHPSQLVNVGIRTID